MSKLIKSTNIMAIVFMLIALNACTKENLVPNDTNNIAIQKWNPDEDCLFVLPEAMQPYQYAIHQYDENHLFEHIRLKLESIEDAGKEKGYFILSYNVAADNNLIYLGFITELSSYYNPNIWIFPDDSTDNGDDGSNMCFGWVIVDALESDNFGEAQAWAHGKMKAGYTVCINKQKNGLYLVTVQVWVDN
jgi:hypothetical protein